MELRGNYIIKPVGVIGNGAFGRVEKVDIFNTAGFFSGSYARKVLAVDARLIGELVSLEDWKERFEREVRYQARCTHSNIVPIYIHHLKTENPWFVMDLAETDLRKEIWSGLLSDDDKLIILKKLLVGVNHMHEKNLLHRDLKPENILKFPGENYKISDFGLVKNTDTAAQSAFLSHVLAEKEIGMGTPDYMAPEAKKGKYTPRTDVYALGVIINELNLSHVKGIDEMEEKATSYRPAGRYESVQQMLDKLASILTRRKS